MDRILIIGGTGLLGNCVSQILEKKYQVDRISSQTGFDICNHACFDSLNGPYLAIINCAAVISNNDDAVDRMLAVNALGALNAARFAQSISSRLIHVSTIFAISNPDNEYYNYYGISKAAGDQLISRYCSRYQVPLTICRFSSLYDTEKLAIKYQAMFYRLIDQVASPEGVSIYGSLNPTRNFLHYEDAAVIISRVLSNNVTGVWNCVHPQNIDIEMLVHLIGKVMGKNPKIQYIHEKPNLLKIHIPEDRLIFKNLTDLVPRPLETGLKEIIEHAKV